MALDEGTEESKMHKADSKREMGRECGSIQLAKSELLFESQLFKLEHVLSDAMHNFHRKINFQIRHTHFSSKGFVSSKRTGGV